MTGHVMFRAAKKYDCESLLLPCFSAHITIKTTNMTTTNISMIFKLI